ncbi:hypothetical protein [Nocardioides sp.]|uniref:hypothetical protein n=1 Tax=Nocardioides sp. TaxID=35761 RepID=UPI00356933E4
MTEPAPQRSALAAWAETVFAGTDDADGLVAADLGLAAGHAHYDPADLISVYQLAAASGRHRAAEARSSELALAAEMSQRAPAEAS